MAADPIAEEGRQLDPLSAEQLLGLRGQGRDEQQHRALPFRDGSFATVVSGLAFCSVGDVPQGLSEARRILDATGVLRMLEHVRSKRRAAAWLQDRAQPAWTWFTGGCRPNRDTEAAVAAAGFTIDPATYWSQGGMRRFEARARGG